MNDHDVTNESHRTACAECTALWADLERLSAEARALPVLSPSRDLWAGIEARLGGTASAAPATSAVGRAQRRWFTPSTLRLATAASLLVAATAAVTWRIASDRTLPTGTTGPDSGATADLARNGTLGGDEPIRLASYQEEFGALDGEIGTLKALVDQRRSQLDPRTVEVLERNLALIDRAIAESREAFLKDPASRFLASQLTRAYTAKLTLLRSTATMPAGT